jgi:acyl-coenzyme A thioesterase PaaI-like protein
VHYLGAARIGDFVEARCRVKRQTRHVVFVESEPFSAGRMVATADGIWKFLSAA